MAREISYENLHFCCFPSRPPWPWPKDFYLRILGGFPEIQLHSYQIHIEKGFGSLAQVVLRTSWPCQIIPQTYYCTEIQRRGALPPYFSPRRTPSKPCGPGFTTSAICRSQRCSWGSKPKCSMVLEYAHQHVTRHFWG